MHKTTTINQTGKILFETAIINPDGTEEPRSKGHNLILDQGMDLLAHQGWANSFPGCAIGTGNTPTSRDSGSTTFTRAGTTVTASTGFFVAGDVGRMLKFDTGERMRITAYASGTSVTVDTTGALGAAQGTVWYVNETGHQTEIARTTGYSTAAGDNLSTFLVDTWTHQRTFLFAAAIANIVVTEIGWFKDSPLFGRALVPGGGDAVGIGQIYKVKVKLSVKLDATQVTTAFADGTFDAGGVGAIEWANISTIDAAGNASGIDGGYPGSNGMTLDPGIGSMYYKLDSSSLALQAMSGVNGPAMTGDIASAENIPPAAYVSLSFTKTFTGGWGLGLVSSAIRSFFVTGGYYQGNRPHFRQLFNAAQSKDSDHNLIFTMRISWDRDMPN